MGKLFDQIQSDLGAALKARAEVELRTLRLLKSELQYEMTKDGAKDLSDEQVLALIKRSVKKRRESIDQYSAAGKSELAAAEEAEIAVLDRYLPAAVGEEAILAIIDQTMERVKPAGPQDMGKIMGPVMGHFKGQNVDGNLVRELVQRRLQA
ncbi:MAG: GatB/YqeY domain-containing protein [Spirochaetales bacterium]|nr:GatB/YqeY domain-containing protein [Leptospiraceae bacterium]MCP5480433.1 GatB/YqeY domain-containing protein [Spirochaetales bacterium]